MKIVFTSMLVLMMTAIQAMPVDKDSVGNGKKGQTSTPVTTTISTATVSMEQLQEENAVLKIRLSEIENRLENENSMLQYKLTMQNLVSKFNEINTRERLEDLEAQVGFTKVMSNVLLLIKAGGTK